MSKITRITMAAAVAASAIVGGAVSASASNSYYGPNAAPYPKSLKAPQPKMTISDMVRPDSAKTGSISDNKKARNTTAKQNARQRR